MFKKFKIAILKRRLRKLSIIEVGLEADTTALVDLLNESSQISYRAAYDIRSAQKELAVTRLKIKITKGELELLGVSV
ncbi:hypothetical protein BcepSauron_115 [Burkholderia phage BcepSauron]|uniref:Uncharacterized protein n=2 Tax=Sarumanvirus TaxID=2843450 RepID=A0A482MLJ8_9CAUD|nr:hypothetical protein H1O16_gp116 [Burkholderia phage BcepSaruman]YP_009904493.1 hypothetical protein H1O17_gp115 [Burkholderia phage BcepSauron]QBQ74495.1 hypothetical protein BcepSauron_115 [Burkholderia phage BcepSauron]QBX06529.1 hypothetical protein BcepSaruman_116 [Burkholderia phage BcepSaruman]